MPPDFRWLYDYSNQFDFEAYWPSFPHLRSRRYGIPVCPRIPRPLDLMSADAAADDPALDVFKGRRLDENRVASTTNQITREHRRQRILEKIQERREELQPPSPSLADGSVAKSRLQACQRDHDCGSRSYEGLDARRQRRLLHVVPQTGVQAGQAGATTVKLVTGCDAPYAALSYCWGGDQPLMLTRATAASLQQGVPASRLSRSIQDAISVAKQLGISHLWINALCIYPIRSGFSCRRFWRHLPP
jgi:hypothetical protein